MALEYAFNLSLKDLSKYMEFVLVERELFNKFEIGRGSRSRSKGEELARART